MNDPPEHEVTIYNAARRLASGERAAYLDEACAGDVALHRRLDELLRVNEGEGDFLEKPALAVPNAAAMPGEAIPLAIPLSEKPGDRIGPYKLLQQIGEGGCGVVYMAEQESPIRRRVALKVIKLGMDTKQVIARFEAERQALALMDHPNIAKVLEAGTTETGRPYFVMELVHGIKITEFCDQDSLTTRQRLGLFMQVCQAIQHAHQKGIIHRDIKPSNILVTVNDGIAVPKVIDFGIAKATQGRLTDETLFTAFGQFMGTPAYMSPEQAVLTGVDVDTRTDIYSLGVLLYELLTGQTPFDPKALLEAGLEEMRRTIREQEPARPSTKLSTMEAGKLTMAAKRRSSEPPKLIHLVRGDLDWIVMKCLEKERNRRYETANGLARDVERHLTEEPIVARPPGRLYQFQKLVRRNKLVFAAVGVVAVVLALGVAVSTWQAIRATRAEREQTLLSHRAEAEAAKSQQVAGFFEDMLDGAGPLTALGRDTTVLREILDEANQKIGSDLAGQPEVEAEIRTKIGEIYLQIGEYAKAEAAGRLALRIRESIFPATNEVVAEALHHLGTVLWREGKTGEAETIENQALERTRTAKGPASLSSAEVMCILGSVHEDKGEIAQGERLFRDALEIIQKLGKPEAKSQGRVDDDLFSLFNDLGMSQAARCDPIEAETNLSQALALAIKRFPTNDYRIASGYNNLANVQQQQESDLGQAETNQRQALLICRTALPDAHPYVSFAKNNLGIILRRRWTLSGDSAQLRESLQLDPNEVLTQEAFASLMAKPDIVPVSSASSSWRFTPTPPAGDWASLDFAGASWTTTNFLCGSVTYLNRLQRNPPTLVSLTNLWLRQEFDLPELPSGKLVFRVNRNHDAQIFLNGVQAAPISDWRDTETLKPASEAGQLALKRGRNVLAIHCQDADGGTPIGVSVCMSSDPSFGRNRLIEELSLLIESNTPPRWAFFAARGASYARLTQWKAAAEDMAKANDLRPPDALFWYQFAPVLVESGDLSGYESLRQRALKLSAGGGDPNSAARVARFALLLPAPPAELESAGKLADLAAEDSVDAGVAVRQFAKGLADVRRGHFESGIEWMRKAFEASRDIRQPYWTHEREGERCAAALFIEAIAYQQSNRPAEARAVLDQGLDLVKNQLASETSGDIGREWPEWINAHLFMREAQALIAGPAK